MFRYAIYYFISFILCHSLLHAEESPDSKAVSDPDVSISDLEDESSEDMPQKAGKKTRIQRKIDKLNQKLQKSPNDLNIHFLLGKYYYLSKDFDKAVFHLKKNKKNPSIKGLILLARIFSQQGNHSEEMRVLNILLERHPDSPKVYTDLGTVYHKIDKIEEAIEHYKTALQKDKKYEEAYKGLWTVFESQDNFYDARQILVDFLALYPNDVEAHSKLCQMNVRSGFLDESLASCNRAVTVGPAYPNNHIYLALVHRRNGNDQQAKRIILTTAKNFKKSVLAQYEAALLLEGESRMESALQFYRDCVRAAPRAFRCVLKTANLEVQLGQYEKATDSFLAACRINKFQSFQEIRDASGLLRTQKKMKWYSHFKKISERCHIVGQDQPQDPSDDPLEILLIKDLQPTQEDIPEDSTKKSLSSDQSDKSDKATTKKTDTTETDTSEADTFGTEEEESESDSK